MITITTGVGVNVGGEGIGVSVAGGGIGVVATGGGAVAVGVSVGGMRVGVGVGMMGEGILVMVGEGDVWTRGVASLPGTSCIARNMAAMTVRMTTMSVAKPIRTRCREEDVSFSFVKGSITFRLLSW